MSILFVLLIRGTRAIAQESGTPSATPQVNTRQVEELKERLATKVAELKNFKRRAIFGTVGEVTITTITVETKTSKVKIELTDELTVIQYIRGRRTLITNDDIGTGDFVTVYGDYDESLDLLRAKVFYIQGPLPTIVSGKVREINRADFTLMLIAQDNREYIVDIETTTDTQLYTERDGLTESGFSKVRVGETLHIVGSALNDKENRFSADRILDLGTIVAPAETQQPSQTP